VGTVFGLAVSGLPCKQLALSLRFDPAAGTRVHTISSSELLAQVVNTGKAPTDTSIVEARRLESTTRFVDAVDGQRRSVYLQYDSVRTRTRVQGSLWRDVEPTERDLASVRTVLDDKMRILSAEFVDVPHLDAPYSEMVRGLGGGAYMPLPEEELAVGDKFAAALRAPTRPLLALSVDNGLPLPGELAFDGTVSLDSVVGRMADTLVYMTAIGRLVPEPFDPGGTHAAVYASGRGSLAATLVWSTAWDAYVTGAVRAVTDVELRRRDDRSLVSSVRLDVTTQFQVRL
jgi:hypothetical protein